MAQVIDKGRIVAAVDKFPAKENGQFIVDANGNQKMKNKWMAIGEATKWQNDDMSQHVTEKIYLRPVSVTGNYFEQKTFWDSENNNAQSQPQQSAPQQGGYQQQKQPQQGFQPQNQQGGFKPQG